MRQNLTVTLEEEILRDARKAAIDRRTSVNQLVRDFLEQLVRETNRQEQSIRQIDELFAARPLEIGLRGWTRDELHER